jgi:hypothetical protein
MTVTSSNPTVASAALTGNGRQFLVGAVGVGSAVVTVVPSDGSAGPATLTVQVQTTTIRPQSLYSVSGATK